MTFLWVVFSSVPRKFPSAGTLGPVQVYFWLGVFSLFFCYMFFNHGSSMDKSTKTLGFGHCLHLSSSGLLATPRLTGKGNTRPSGTSVRFPSLSPSILAIDAVTSTALARTCILSANLPLPATFPPSSHLSSLLPGLPKAGLLARPRGRLVPGASPALVATRKSPEVLGSSGNLLEQRRDLQRTISVPRNPGSRARYFQSQSKYIRMSVPGLRVFTL